MWLRANCANLCFFVDEDSVFVRLVLPSASWDSICMYACTQDADMGYGRCRTPESQLQLGARSFPTMSPVIRAEGCRCRAMTRQIGGGFSRWTLPPSLQKRHRFCHGTMERELTRHRGTSAWSAAGAPDCGAASAAPSTVPCSICILRCFTLARLSRASLALLSDNIS